MRYILFEKITLHNYLTNRSASPLTLIFTSTYLQGPKHFTLNKISSPSFWGGMFLVIFSEKKVIEMMERNKNVNNLLAIVLLIWFGRNFRNFIGCHPYRGCVKKKFPNGLLNNSKMVDPTVKPQAKGQNYFSIALKWGIVHFDTLNTFGDTMKFRKFVVF